MADGPPCAMAETERPAPPPPRPAPPPVVAKDMIDVGCLLFVSVADGREGSATIGMVLLVVEDSFYVRDFSFLRLYKWKQNETRIVFFCRPTSCLTGAGPALRWVTHLTLFGFNNQPGQKLRPTI
jgi:hypothetical protein